MPPLFSATTESGPRATRTLPLLWLLALLFGPNVLAQVPAEEPEPPRWFQIELVIFETVAEFREGDERPLEQPPGLDPTGVRPLAFEGSGEPAFMELPREAFGLLEEAAKIDQSRRYQLLTHIAWRQPVEDAERAVTVRIPAGESALTAAAEVLADPELAPVIAFEGNITVSVSRYLHLNADIIRRERVTVEEEILAPEPPPQALVPEGPGALFQDVLPPQTPQIQTRLVERIVAHRLTERRRMRSKKLHYLDHPVLGVLALITPYEPPPVPEPAPLAPPTPLPTPGSTALPAPTTAPAPASAPGR